MICPKCNGVGYVKNGHADKVASDIAWSWGYLDPIKCRVCGGSGFVLGNAHEIIERLNLAIKNKQPLSMREIKQIKLQLQK